MTHLPAFVLILVGAACATGGTPEEHGTPLPIVKNLWPTKTQEEALERVLPDRGDNTRRITDISQPSMTLYHGNQKGIGIAPAILVFPGGGYSILAINKEGTEVAEWLNGIGITAVVVKYSVPKNREGAFEDAQRAIRLVRHQAEEWSIDPQHIGVLGFSAGGHLCARLSTDFKHRTYARQDDADDLECRPDFCVLVYPAYLINKETNELADELPVTRNTPPTLMIQTEDDRSFVGGTIAYEKALKESGVPCVFNRFPDGGHGYGLRPSKHQVSQWPTLCEEWFRANSIIESVSDEEPSVPRKKNPLRVRD